LNVKPLVFASTNLGKVAEIATLLEGLPLEVVPLSRFPGAPAVIEDGATFAANAAKKAVAIRDFTGVSALADDSGLCVDALNGRPGVHSARYAGVGVGDGRDAANIASLLAALKAVPDAKRGAEFRCVLCFAPLDAPLLFAEGICRGVIATEPRGKGGFGYDPLFVPTEGTLTFGELPPEAKNAVSHRRQAVEAMKPHLSAWALDL
jgi:XTP/dITP diphosphohydrolase